MITMSGLLARAFAHDFVIVGNQDAGQAAALDARRGGSGFEDGDAVAMSFQHDRLPRVNRSRAEDRLRRRRNPGWQG
jgi:hypothetical protein